MVRWVSIYWVIGLLEGDGYIDDRHVEFFNSEKSILKELVISLTKTGIGKDKIKVDIYTEKLNLKLIDRWSKKLRLPRSNFKLRKNTSPWKSNKEKIRIRVASKELCTKLRKLKIKNKKRYVQGLLDAEGSVDIKGYIEFKQVYNKKGKILVKRVYDLVKYLGIDATTPKIKNDLKKQDLYFYIRDLKKYEKIIGFIDKNKKEKLSTLIKILDINNKPTLKEVENAYKRTNSIWQTMIKTKSPYHRVRRALRMRTVPTR